MVVNVFWFIATKTAKLSDSKFAGFIIRIATVSVALSVMVMIIATSLVNGFQFAIKEKVFAFWSHIQIRPFELTYHLSETPIYAYPEFYKKDFFPGVSHIQWSASKGALVQSESGFEGMVLRGAGNDFLKDRFTPFITKGKFINEVTDTTKQPLLISSIMASRLKVDVGDEVVVSFMDYPIKMKKMKICGLFESGLEEYDQKIAFVNLSVIQQINRWGKDSVGVFELVINTDKLSPPRWKTYALVLFGRLLSKEAYSYLSTEPIDEITSEVFARVKDPRLDVMSIKDLEPGIFDWLYLQNMNEIIILFILFCVIVVNLSTSLLILIVDRSNMIAVLKTLGASNRNVRKVFLSQAVIILTKGIFIGNVLGIGLCMIQEKCKLIRLDPASYYIDYAPAKIDFGWILVINLFIIIFSLICLIMPASYVSTVQPARLFRFK